MSAFKYAVVGSGNVASYLLSQLNSIGAECTAIILRDINKLKALNRYLSKSTTCISLQNNDGLNGINVDYIFLAVSDDAINEVSCLLPVNCGAVIHCSGSCSLNSIDKKHINRGVFYPLQSILKTEDNSNLEVPILIEANGLALEDKLKGISLQLNLKATIVDSAQRLRLHLCAVYMNNFINYIVGSVESILEKEQLEKELLMPLMHNTLDRISKQGAIAVQTGPAKRGDINTLNAHRALLSESEVKVYDAISEAIFKRYKGTDVK